MSKTNPVLVTMSIVAGLTVLFGAMATDGHEVIQQIGAYGTILVGAVTAGVQFYVSGQVVPNRDVAEQIVAGHVVAGPANDLLPTGVKVRDVGALPEVTFASDGEDEYSPRHATPEDGPLS